MATSAEFSRLLATITHQIKTHAGFKTSHLYGGINPVGRFWEDLFKNGGGRIEYDAQIQGIKDLEALAKNMRGQSELSILSAFQSLFPTSALPLSTTSKQRILDYAKTAVANNYAYDMLDDFDKERETLTEKYGGGSLGQSRADEAMRNNVLKQLPGFFKDSKRSTKELYRIAGYANRTSHLYGGINPVGRFWEDLFKNGGGRMSTTSKQRIFDYAKTAAVKNYAKTRTTTHREIGSIDRAIQSADYVFRTLNPELAKKADYKDRFGDFWEEAWNADELADKRERVKGYLDERRKATWRKRAAGRESFRYDMLDDFDKERETLTEKYGGGSLGQSRADEVMRRNVLKQLPGFFKDSKRSTKELYRIAGYAKVFPRAFSSMNMLTRHPGVVALMGAKYAIERSFGEIQKIAATSNMARASGTTLLSAVTRGLALSGYGGNERTIAEGEAWWNNLVGNILMGGGVDELIKIDRYGINPMGSGPGGFATREEKLARAAKILPKLDRARQIALKNDIHASDSEFNAMLDHPEDFKDWIHRFDAYQRFGYGDENVAVAGRSFSESAGNLGASLSSMWGEIGRFLEPIGSWVVNDLAKSGWAISNDFKNLADFTWGGGNNGRLGALRDMFESGINSLLGFNLGSDLMDWLFGGNENAEKAKEAAESSAKEDATGGSTSETKNDSHDKQVSMAVNQVILKDVKDPNDFMNKMSAYANGTIDYVLTAVDGDPAMIG